MMSKKLVKENGFLLCQENGFLLNRLCTMCQQQQQLFFFTILITRDPLN